MALHSFDYPGSKSNEDHARSQENFDIIAHDTFVFPHSFHFSPTKITFSPDPPLFFPISVITARTSVMSQPDIDIVKQSLMTVRQLWLELGILFNDAKGYACESKL